MSQNIDNQSKSVARKIANKELVFQNGEKEKRSAELIIANKEKQHHARIENGNDAIVIFNLEGKPTYVSRSIKRVLGYSEEEAMQLGIYKIVHPDDREALSNKMAECLIKPGICLEGHVCRIKHKSGSWKWVEATITNMLHDPAINGIVDNFRDITERKLAEQKLAESEKNLHHVLSSASDSFYVIDRKGYVTLINKRASENMEKAWGNPVTVGTNILNLIPNEIDEPIRSSLVKVFAGETVEYELHLFIKNLPAWWQVNYLPVKDDMGAIVCAYITTKDITEKKVAEETIRESNERYELVTKATSDMVWDWNLLTGKVYRNKEGWKKIFKSDLDNSIGNEEVWQLKIHPEDKERVKQIIQEIINSVDKKFFEIECRVLRNDKSCVFIHDKGYIMRNEEGRAIRLVGATQDITERKIAEQQLKESELFNKGILASLSSHIAVIDHKGNIIAVNKAWDDFAKSNCVDLLEGVSTGSNYIEVCQRSIASGDSLAAQTLQGIQSVFNKEVKIFELEYPCHSLTEQRWFNFSAMNFGEDDSKVVISHQNITQRKKTEQKLQQSELKYRQIVETAQEGILVIDKEGITTFVNQKMCDIIGYTSEEMIGKTILFFKDDEGMQIAKNNLERRREGITETYNSSFMTKDGRVIWTQVSSNPVLDENGKYSGALAMVTDITEKKKADEMLQQSEQEYRKIALEKQQESARLIEVQAIAKIGSWETDLQTFNAEWSEETHHIFETDPKKFQVTHEAFLNFTHPEDRNKVITAFENSFNSQTINSIEYRIIATNGTVKHVIENWKIIRDAQGHPVRAMGTCQDITDRKIAEEKILKLNEEVAKSGNFFKGVLESSADMITLIDPAGKTIYASPAISKTFGYTYEECLEINIADIVHPDDALIMQEFVMKIKMHPGVPMEGPLIRDRKKDGSYIWVEGTLTNFLETEGINAIIANFRDVTERKKAEESIRQSNERFEKVTQATNDAIWDWDIVNDNLYRGNGFNTLFGYEVNKNIQAADFWQDKFHSEDLPLIKESLQKVIEDPNATHWQKEYRIIKNTGKIATVIDRGIVIRSPTGKPLRLVGAMTDITYRKEYEDSLKRLNVTLEKHAQELAISNKELEEFAYVASHDLQEPLRMVTGFLGQIEKKYSDIIDDKGKQYIHFATDGAKRMRQIILDLLEFSRVGKVEEKEENIDLNKVVREVIILSQKRIKETKAIIKFENLPLLLASKSALRQVFQNLISNALKYHKKDQSPVINISAEEASTYWQFAIKDNGIGIEEEYFNKIFIIFQRLHNKDEYTGTGIGLAVCKKIIENFGGNIWLASEENKGSTFYFTIPKK